MIENLLIGMGLALVAGVLSRLPGRSVPAVRRSVGSAQMMVLGVGGSGGFTIQPANGGDSLAVSE